jgi:ectoine hydroxylase-related dioxygenase (phytanoyl-CoA dioxygenase family)
LVQNHIKSGTEIDNNGVAVSIIDLLRGCEAYSSLYNSSKLLEILQNFLGPDIAMFDYDALWINVPKESDPVLSKNQHTDVWTGTSINTIIIKLFLTDVDDYDSVSVSPGSHLQGLLPVRNRQIDQDRNLEFDDLNINIASSGDLLLWHNLLIHSTVGHSNKNTRISITTRFTSTETPFSSQERALGYKTFRVGPMNQILRLIGNDLLTPLRTYGGFVGIDRRLGKISQIQNSKLLPTTNRK